MERSVGGEGEQDGEWASRWRTEVNRETETKKEHMNSHGHESILTDGTQLTSMSPKLHSVRVSMTAIPAIPDGHEPAEAKRAWYLLNMLTREKTLIHCTGLTELLSTACHSEMGKKKQTRLNRQQITRCTFDPPSLCKYYFPISFTVLTKTGVSHVFSCHSIVWCW